MADHLLAPTDIEEALSRAYIQAVAAKNGYTVGSRDFDRDGIDAQIQAGGGMRPCLDLQLKATINLDTSTEDTIRFPLKRRNYDTLIIDTMVPRILVVLDLPKDREQWMIITESELILRRRAYWVNLCGKNETLNTDSVTISIPKTNIFDPPQLKAMMETIRTGSRP